MADIFIHYGTDGDKMAYALMDRADVQAQIPKDCHIVIKPNLVLADKPENGATTHVSIVSGIIRYLVSFGFTNITIAEGSWVGEKHTGDAFDYCGYRALAEKYRIRLLDTKKDQLITRSFAGETYKLCKTVAQAGYLINVPVLKGHCQTKLTCCMKNLKGCIPDSEKRRYHTMGLSRPIAALGNLLRPHLHVIDSICGDLTFEEGGNPVESNRVLLGFDTLLLDSYCAGLIGYRPDEIGYLQQARADGLGGFADETTSVEEIDARCRPKVSTLASSRAKRLSAYINEDSACSACYAALVFALDKAAYKGSKINIGQGFRGKTGPGFGVGSCASGCQKHVKGCPPSAVDILRALEQD